MGQLGQRPTFGISGKQLLGLGQAPTSRDPLLPPFFVVAGAPGVGKSVARAGLARAFPDLTSLGPDEFDCWGDVYDQLDLSPQAIIECCRLPRALREKRRRRGAYVILLTASPRERARRQAQRGLRFCDESDGLGLGYEEPLAPDFELDTTDLSVEQVVARLSLVVSHKPLKPCI